jgi:two-component system NtrC family sensor kinase
VFAKWPIRKRLLTGVALLLAAVALLSWSGMYGLYAYRSLVKSLGCVSEFRLATQLAQCVGDLRVAAYELLAATRVESPPGYDGPPPEMRAARGEFRRQLQRARHAVRQYREGDVEQPSVLLTIGDSPQALQTLDTIARSLEWIEQAERRAGATLDPALAETLLGESERMQGLVGAYPGYLYQEVADYADGVRDRYRTFIGLAWTTAALAAVVFVLLVRLAVGAVVRPLGALVQGGRRLAEGQFEHRIPLQGKDEMAELAAAMNALGERFVAIRSDLDRRVKQRTRQLIRAQRWATIGFLAAGVSHEINNPLASIAISAESLERQLRGTSLCDMPPQQQELVAQYVRRIQHEADRCRQITRKLLDCSQMGDERHREPTDLVPLVRHAIEVLGPLGKYRSKHIVWHAPAGVPQVDVNPQEMQQVVLNLLSNALESTGPQGYVEIRLEAHAGNVELIVQDDGCGMTEEVLEHLFEPFFTRRPVGEGTGLGLSIAHRIVTAHGGQIEASSAGPGRGAQFVVRLPACPVRLAEAA